MSATKAYEAVKARAEAIRNDEPQTAGAMSPGDAWAQGDLALVCLEVLPAGAALDAAAPAQLAPGTSQGSRHLLDNRSAVELYRLKSATPLVGPVIDARGAGCTVTHPEHGDVTLPPGIYQVRYQRAYAEELRRIED